MSGFVKHIMQQSGRKNGFLLRRAIVLCCTLFSFHYEVLWAQVIKNSGAVITISSGTVINKVLDIENTTGTIANEGTINLTGNWTNGGSYSSTSGTVDYNGSGSQNVAGLSYHHLTLSTSGTKTLSTDASVSGALTVSGTANFASSSGTLTMSGSSITGTGTLSLNGLTIGAAASSSMNFTVNGILTLNNNLTMGSNTLTMGASATTVGAGDVEGIVTRTTLVANTVYTFGNQFTTITFQNDGTLPTVISVKIVIGSAPSWRSGAILRYYEVIRTGGINSYATLNLHYRDSELNGNTEANIVKWASESSNGFTLFEELGRSNYNLTDNWSGQSNFPVSTWHNNTVFGERQLTLDDPSGSNTSTWTGNTNGDWDNTGNWSPAVIPTSTIAAIIPSTTNKPTISGSGQSVKSIEIQTGGQFNLSSTTLTIEGGTGAWINNGTLNSITSTVVFTNAAATISGITDFYDLTINSGAELQIGSSAIIRIGGVLTNNGIFEADDHANTVEYNGTAQTVINPNGTTPGYSTLKLSGSGIKTMPASALNIIANFTLGGTASVTAGAALTVGGDVTLAAGTVFNASTFTHNVAGSWTNSGGTFTAGTSTINMTGSNVQTVEEATFYNLTIAKSGGRATLSGSITVNSDLTISSGTLDLTTFTANRTTVGGTLLISPAGSLVLGGSSGGITGSNFPSNFSILTLSGTVEYNGTGAQTIATVTYGQLTFTNSGMKTIGTSMTVQGNLTINSGSAGTVDPSVVLQIDGNMNLTGSITNNGTINVGN